MSCNCYEIACDDSRVEIWLSRRLPFEPVGHIREARERLRTALASLEEQPRRIISATYTSSDLAPCDAENVLFYNVGASAFNAVAGAGLHFERRRSAPPAAPSGGTYGHYHSYVMVEPPSGWEPGCELEFTTGALTSSTKTHDVWWAATHAAARATGEFSGPFEMRIDAYLPCARRNAAALIKPLVDGVVCAMHSDVVADPEAVAAIASRLEVENRAVRDALASPVCPVLGERSIVRPYRRGVKWDPADDLCDACTLILRQEPRCDCRVEVAVRQAGGVL